MNEISNNSKNKKIENDISKLMLNKSSNYIDNFSDNKYNVKNVLNGSSSINFKNYGNENNNVKNSLIKNRIKNQITSSNEILFSNSNLSSSNHSFQNLSKIEKRISNKNKKQEQFNLNKTISFLSNINQKDYISNEKNINDKKFDLSYKTYYQTFNYNKSNILKQKKSKNKSEELNKLYNYGESLTKELKLSNDKNTELIKKYINLKAELQIKENQNNELENKMNNLKKQQSDLNKSNQEFAQNISCVQKIIDNNKIHSNKSISESENTINLNQKKISELNIINSKLFEINKEYEKEIIRLQNIVNDFKNNKNDLIQFEYDNNEGEINIIDKIEKLKKKK